MTILFSPAMTYKVGRRLGIMRMIRFSFALCTMMAVTIGCDGVGASSPRDDMIVQVPEVDVSPVNDPDTLWGELVTLSQFEPDAGSNLNGQLVSVERQKQKFRELGLRFWENHPDDPRRYSWLILTVALPPVFPIDLEQWAANEISLEPNRSSVQLDKHSEWSVLYPELRSALWNAVETTDRHRRFLWASELKQKLLANRAAMARGEESLDSEDILAEIVAFVTEYNEPLDSNDDPVVTFWLVDELIDLIMTRDDTLVVSNEQKQTFIDNLAAIEATLTSNIAQSLSGDGLKTSSWWSAKYFDELSPFQRENPNYDWESGSLKDAPIYAAILYKLHNFPARHQSKSVEEQIVYHHDWRIVTQQYYELGAKYWDFMSDQDRLDWFWWMSQRPPQYFEPFWASAFAPIKIFGTDEQLHLPQEAVQVEFYAEYKRIMRALLPSIEDVEERQRFEHAPLWMERTLLWLNNHYGHRSPSARGQALLNDMRSYYEKYPDGDTSVLSSLAKDSSRFGIERAAIVELLVALSKSEGGAAKDLAVEAMAVRPLKKGDIISFQLPDLDGKPFDTRDLFDKYVLIDHWDTKCSACIASFPRIHDIYIEYKGRGFEVVSIAYDGASQKRRVERIKDEMGLTWPTLNGEGSWDRTSVRFSYNGYPQYMLLGPGGEFIAGTDDVDLGRNLRQLLDAQLEDSELPD